MKNFTLILLLAFWCSFAYAIQQDETEDSQITNERIQQLLNDAEVSVNMLDFDNAIEQLNSSLELSKSINDKRAIALSSSILAKGTILIKPLPSCNEQFRFKEILKTKMVWHIVM